MNDDDAPTLIPGSLLALLRDYWNPAQDGFSHFEVNHTDDRRTDASGYVYRRGTDANPDLGPTFSSQEAAALAKEDLFERFFETDGETHVLNEHAQHAIQDFLEETYAAWAKCQERLNRIR